MVHERASNTASVFRLSVEPCIRHAFQPLLRFIRFRYLLDDGLDLHACTVSRPSLTDPSLNH